jgi:Flp pilus assembly protein TadD
MRRSILVVAVLVVAVGGVLLTSLKRVAGDEQGLRIHRDGTTTSYAPGAYLLPPFSGRFLKFPLGVRELRFPAQGSWEVLTEDGTLATVALSIRSEFRPESGPFVLSTLGHDFLPALEAKVRESIEIQTARFSALGDGTMPDGYQAAVIDDIKQTLNSCRILMAAYRFDEWAVGAGPRVSVDPKPLRKIVFVGVDGADWQIIDDLIVKDRLPNFEKLVQQGATGKLRSMEPMLSPLLWTTMATGRLPEDHGILNFTVIDPSTGNKVPISRLYRRVDAFWNMLSDYGRSVDVVGWLATFPAEPINGAMVTDRVGYLAYADADGGETAMRGSVSPEKRRGEITDLVVESRSVQWEEFRRFVRINREAFVESRSLPFDPKNPVNNLIMLYASTRTFSNIASHLADGRPDFLAVYFEWLDATKHLFMQYAPPRQPEVDESAYNMYKDAVAEAYVYQDSIIGEFIARCDENTVLVVASDHGFKSGASRPKLRPEIWAGHAASWHRMDGIICLYGNGIRKGVRIQDASILDIAPSVLALQGLPHPQDMPGKILEDALEQPLLASLNRARVPTLQRKREIDELAASTGDAATDEALKKLEALGYITPDNPDAHNNLGQRYQEQGKYREAGEEFEKALAMNPNFPGAWNNLGVCYGRLRRYDDAESALKKAIGLNPEDVYAMNNLAVMFIQLNRLEDARVYGERSITIEPNYANGHLTLGAIHATMGKLDLAEAEFRKVLEIDPGNESAQNNLERLRSQRDAN